MYNFIFYLKENDKHYDFKVTLAPVNSYIRYFLLNTIFDAMTALYHPLC